MTTSRNIDYEAILGRARETGEVDLAALGSMLSDAFADAYRSALGEPADLLEVDQDGFTFLFDFSSGSRTPNGRATEDRVVGAWGLSRPPPAPRDRPRMRGFPSPRRPGDTSERDRGHLFGHALGGGLDINLFPQETTVNRGRSDEGRVFRRMERYAAAHPGTFCFIRLIYSDSSWRPVAFDYGLLKPDGLMVERFSN